VSKSMSGTLPPVPDDIDLILETDALLSIAAAERVAAFRRRALRDAVPFRGATLEIAERSLRLELAAAMRITERAVDRLTFMAEALTDRYPAMLDSLRGARSTVRHAEIFVDLADTVEPHLREQVVEQGVGLAERLPVGAFRAELRKTVDVLRAQTLPERHAQALQDRRIAVEPAGDGMAWFMNLLPTVEAHAAFERATKIAEVMRDQPGETRTLNQLRSDLTADLLIDGRVDTHPDAVQSVQVEVVVTVAALSLLDDAHAATHPAVVEGVGPVPIGQARAMCGGQKDWMRVLTHPETGMILSVGRTKYRPPKPLRRLVTWRAGTCRGPGCRMPAARCQIDHNQAWAQGGGTDVWNLAPFCTGHHTVKHHGGWQVRQLPGGVIEWTSPTGRVHLVEPERPTPAFVPSNTPAPF
jgi:hypothetical protein